MFHEYILYISYRKYKNIILDYIYIFLFLNI